MLLHVFFKKPYDVMQGDQQEASSSSCRERQDREKSESSGKTCVGSCLLNMFGVIDCLRM